MSVVQIPETVPDSGQTPLISRWLLSGLALVVVGSGLYHLNEKARARRTLNDQAMGMCRAWADDLASNTTEGGTFIRKADNYDLMQDDPWDNALHVTYTKSGFSETLKVASSGPDGLRGTRDDLSFAKHIKNLSGIGSGIRDNIEKTTHGASKGLFSGAIEGIKEGIKGKGDDKDTEDD